MQKLVLISLALSAFMTLILPVNSGAYATSPVSCGSTITQSSRLTSDLGPCSGDGIVIGADNISLDCQGHTITGSFPPTADIGITLIDRSGVTVRNCNVTNFAEGVLVLNSNNNMLAGNIVTNARGGAGFDILDSNANRLVGNTATGSKLCACAGFSIVGSDNNLSGNTASSDDDGFVIDSEPSFGVTTSDNRLVANIASNNLDDGFFIFNSANRNSFQGNTANNNAHNGFEVQTGSSNTFAGNTADGNGFGFPPFSSSGGYGYLDSTSGSGTAGTANLYHGDECSGNDLGGSSPSGLCAPI